MAKKHVKVTGKRMEKCIEELDECRQDLHRLMYGFSSEDKTAELEFKQKVQGMVQRYGEDFSVSVSIAVYKDLTGDGKVVVKNVPISCFNYEEMAFEPVQITDDVHAFEVYARGVSCGNKRQYVLGEKGEDGNLISYKVVIGSPDARNRHKLDKMGTWADAQIFSRQDLADFCELVHVDGYTDAPGLNV